MTHSPRDERMRSATKAFAGPINQLGYLVPDLEKAIEGFLSLGIGPWLTLGGVTLGGYEYRGRASSPKIDVAFGQMGKAGSGKLGSVIIELVRPANDESSYYGDLLAAGRWGMQSLVWYSESFDSDVDALRAAGQTLLQKAELGGMRFVYFDTTDSIGSCTELIELNAISRKLFGEIEHAVDTWDGETDPVRRLLPAVLHAGLELQTMAGNVGRWWKDRIQRQAEGHAMT
jgi:hypothetical protein